MRRTALLSIIALVLALLPFSGVSAAPTGTHSENLDHIKNISYTAKNGGAKNAGTDIEFGEVGGREYAFAGSYRNGLQIVDITEPRDAYVASVYDCGVTQGDVQVFSRDDLPGRTFVTYTSDTVGDGTSTCYREAAALGFSVKKPNGSGKNGTFIADVTDPLAPKTVSFVEVTKGSHNMTVHPSGKFLYNSNSDLITSPVLSSGVAIEIFDITDFAKPVNVANLALPIRPGLGTESHDLTFNKSGARAYSAALSQGVIINTENPAKPSIVSSFMDPAINVWHQADPFTLTDASGKKRDFLIAEDEYAGAAGGPHCPSGGVHVYEITGDLEKNPSKVGYWNLGDVGPTPQATGRCTAHVFDIHEDEAIMTIAFYNGGVRVVDISGLTGYSLGGTQITPGAGMKELAFYKFSNSDTWAAKTPHIQGNGDFFLYGNDQARGMDIYKFDAGKKESKNKGEWMSASEAAIALPKASLPAGYQLNCLLAQKD